MNYPDDANTYNLDDEFMIGDDILVAPVVKPDVTQRLVYLPKGVWYDYWTNKKYQGETTITVEAPLETVPMFVRGGAIIPTGPDLKYVGEKPFDPITFNIYPDDKGSASVTLYEDDGISPVYKQDGFRRTTISARRIGALTDVTISAPAGKYQPGKRSFGFVVKSTPRRGVPVTIVDDGTSRSIRVN